MTPASAALVALLAATPGASAGRFEPGAYAAPDGAITVAADGDRVDPYFALLALDVAADCGFDVRGPARAFIAWLLPRQRPDGRFDRWCKADGAWRACAPADADDALLALWAATLHREAGQRAWPPGWAQSERRALAALAALRDPATGVYRVAPGDPSAFLMDNVEVEAALRAVAGSARRRGQAALAVEAQRRARALRRSMVRVFPAGPDGLLAHRAPPAPGEALRFYPEAAAQLYPWLHRTPVRWPGSAGWRSWFARFGPAWSALRADDYPWGLAALVARARGDRAAAEAWWRDAAALRGGARWNVLEEAAWQVLAPPHRGAACSIG